jgi:hypothetical protein
MTSLLFNNNTAAYTQRTTVLLLLLVCIDRSICCLPCSISLRVKSMNVKHTVPRYIRLRFKDTSLLLNVVTRLCIIIA